MFYKTIVILFVFVGVFTNEKFYPKQYFDNGNIKAEGWLLNGQKIDYWKTYYKNGVLKEEGRYKAGKKVKYWYFYSTKATLLQEGHYNNDVKENW